MRYISVRRISTQLIDKLKPITFAMLIDWIYLGHLPWVRYIEPWCWKNLHTINTPISPKLYVLILTQMNQKKDKSGPWWSSVKKEKRTFLEEFMRQIPTFLLYPAGGVSMDVDGEAQVTIGRRRLGSVSVSCVNFLE